MSNLNKIINKYSAFIRKHGHVNFFLSLKYFSCEVDIDKYVAPKDLYLRLSVVSGVDKDVLEKEFTRIWKEYANKNYTFISYPHFLANYGKFIKENNVVNFKESLSNYLRCKTSINPKDTVTEIIDQISILYTKSIEEVIETISNVYDKRYTSNLYPIDYFILDYKSLIENLNFTTVPYKKHHDFLKSMKAFSYRYCDLFLENTLDEIFDEINRIYYVKGPEIRNKFVDIWREVQNRYYNDHVLGWSEYLKICSYINFDKAIEDFNESKYCIFKHIKYNAADDTVYDTHNYFVVLADLLDKDVNDIFSDFTKLWANKINNNKKVKNMKTQNKETLCKMYQDLLKTKYFNSFTESLLAFNDAHFKYTFIDDNCFLQHLNSMYDLVPINHDLYVIWLNYIANVNDFSKLEKDLKKYKNEKDETKNDGYKDKHKKLMTHELDAEFIKSMAEVLSINKVEWGGKYERGNHYKNINPVEILESMERHLLEVKKHFQQVKIENLKDSDNCSHIVKIAVNAMMLHIQLNKIK